ncbi:hypothetical protein [Cereibacter sphaeroides]|uniref:hypothetical protein n=1 Tax=Cereibacter sphaeroides TaxID=1063 RepID=UPI003FCD8932
MASKQIIAYGAKVERSTDGTTGWTVIPEAKGIAVPVVEQDYQDVTSLDSEGGYRDYIKGLKDIGQITIPMGYTSAGYAAMIADQEAPNPIHYRVTMKPAPDQSTGDVFEFRGFPVPQIEAGDLGAPVGINLNIRGTGAPTWTRGTEA